MVYVLKSKQKLKLLTLIYKKLLHDINVFHQKYKFVTNQTLKLEIYSSH